MNLTVSFVSICLSFAAILFGTKFFKPSSSASTITKMTKATIPNPNPFPTFFISHGGPTFMYRDQDFVNKGAYDAVKKLGKRIKHELKPDYIIVVSAHWQSSASNLVEIAVPPKPHGLSNTNSFRSGEAQSRLLDPEIENPLIYDFYGFPQHMYREEFHTKASRSIASQIQEKLQEEGTFKSRITPRGIDHGVWVPFNIAFSNFTTLSKPQPSVESIGWDLPDTKVIQVSLTSKDRDFESHFKLGQQLDFFRKNSIWDEDQGRYLNGMIVCSGMSVHNLRDLGYVFEGKLAPYTKPFGELLSKLVLTKDDDYLSAYKELQTNPAYNKLLYLSHPTTEHFVPIVVASGIASNSNDTPKELYNAYDGSLAWGMYEFTPK